MYQLGPLPKEAPSWITRELLSISEGFELPRQFTAYTVTQVEPEKPRDGMFTVAQGAWNPGYGEGPYIRLNEQWLPMFGASVGEAAIIACSDETTALSTGLKRTFHLPYAVAIDEVIASFTTAPTGSAASIDIKAAGTSILSTALTVDAGEETSLTAATPAVISSVNHAKGTKITIHLDQAGATIAGTGLKVSFVWRRITT